MFLAADGTSQLLLVEGEDGMYLYAPCLRWTMEPNEFGYQYDAGQGDWARTCLLYTSSWPPSDTPTIPDKTSSGDVRKESTR